MGSGPAARRSEPASRRRSAESLVPNGPRRPGKRRPSWKRCRKALRRGVPAPNPRRVRYFGGEGHDGRARTGLAGGRRAQAGRSPAPAIQLGQVPVLELDDSTAISETVLICRYLEALKPGSAAVRRDPSEIGLIDMWIRRVEQQVGARVGHVWINTHPIPSATPGPTASSATPISANTAGAGAERDGLARPRDRRRDYIAGDAWPRWPIS